jgi:hypothetical protein
MQRLIVFNESTANLTVRLLLYSKLLLVEELKDAVHGQHEIEPSHAGTKDRLPSNPISNLIVKDKLANCPQQQCGINQFHSADTELTVDILVDAGSSQ